MVFEELKVHNDPKKEIHIYSNIKLINSRSI